MADTAVVIICAMPI